MLRNVYWITLSSLIFPGFLVVCLVGCADEDASSLDSRLQTALERSIVHYQIPGAVAGVGKPGGSVWRGAAGLADLEPGDAINTELHFHIGSLTKSFTATLFLLAAEDKGISLDDTIDSWLPGVVSGGSEITIRNLLQMRSGLAHFEENPDFIDIFISHPLHVFTPEELLSYCNSNRYGADELFDYNNINYVIVGMIIEKAFEQEGYDYSQAMQTMVLDPLGLSHSQVPASEDIPRSYAHGYLYEKGCVLDRSMYWDPSAFGAAGSMISSLDDLMIWIEALMDGRLLSPAMHSEQFALVPTEADPDSSYGLGVGEKDGMMGHSGNYNGLYTSALYRVGGYDIVVLTNGQDDGGGGQSTASNVLKDLVAEIFYEGPGSRVEPR